MNLKSIWNTICPQIEDGVRVPCGFSWSIGWGITFRLPLPLRYKMWSVWRHHKVWGNLNLFIDTNRGFELWWCEDR